MDFAVYVLTWLGIGTGTELGVAADRVVESYARPLEYAAPEAVADDQGAVVVSLG